MNGKRYFNEIKKKCLHQLFSKLHNYFCTKSPRTSIHFRQRCTSFWNPPLKKLVFCFWNQFLTADFTLPSVLLYSYQHTDHQKRLAFVCEFQLDELFSAVKNSITARCLNQTPENSSISMCTGWGLYASVCSRWSMREERYQATTQNRFYPDMSNVNKNITVEAKLISPPTYTAST